MEDNYLFESVHEYLLRSCLDSRPQIRLKNYYKANALLKVLRKRVNSFSDAYLDLTQKAAKAAETIKVQNQLISYLQEK